MTTTATPTTQDSGSWATQWSVLSARSVLQGAREGELAFALVGPLVFFICFYVPLRHSLDGNGGSYAQYLIPVIVLQAMLFTAMSAADRAAHDTHGGMGARLRSLPVGRLVGMCARATANTARAALSLIGAVVVGLIFGFRIHGGVTHVVAFGGLAVLFALAISFGADALGSLSRSREAAGIVLLVPQLLLTMLSTGIVPAEGFPEWIRPIVRNQPVSVIADALRGLAAGDPSGSAIAASLAWIAALGIGFALIAIRIEHRER